ncbi:MAG: TldD/PmbA family protein, partial [Syntrophales bacterium LBB04]|nr:TldD/PmbA family protein [Syntrophales bacterium LBB04]
VEEDLKRYDPEEEDIPIALRIQIAQELERKTLQYDPSLIPDGVSLSSHSGHRVLANSAGYCEGYLFSASSMSSSCAVPDDQVGWNTSRKQSSYWYDANIQFHRLASIDSIARTAADRTLRKRGAQKPKTQKAPVIFENMVARTFLSYVAAGVTGHNLYTKQSYLLDKLNQKVAGGNITLVDDPLLPGCLGSKPFDAEGVRARKKYVIEKGVLKNYLLDSYSARKLGLKTSGDAGSFGNLSLLAGPYSLEQLIASIDNGVLITSFSGFGALIRNGDFSQGAQGFWILNGKIAFPVNEFTITSTFDEILHNIEMIGNDPLTNGTILAPSFKVREMTISGT